MKKLKAVHYLVLASAVKGVADNVAPGQIFNAREDELYLIKRGAARELEAAEQDLPVHLRPGESTVKQEVKQDEKMDGEEQGALDLTRMTKGQLIAFAEEEDLQVDASLNKADYLVALLKAVAVKADGGLI